MNRSQTFGRQDTREGQPTGLPKVVIIALFVWLTAVSFITTGYRHIYGSNHPYQLVLVQKINDPTLYPNDAFADTVWYYASAFWYVVALLSRLVDLSVVLLLFFIVNKFLFLFAGLRLARAFFPHSQYAPVIGMTTLATFPQLLFGDGYLTDSTQQTTFAIAFTLLAISDFLDRKWISFAFWLGMALNSNLMFAAYGISYLISSWLVYFLRDSSLVSFYKILASFLGGLLIGAPGIFLVFRATMDADYDATAVWKTVELTFPTHFYPQLWEVHHQLLALMLASSVIFVVYRFRDITPVGIHLAVWSIVALGWYLLGRINIFWIHSTLLLHLHPVRALTVWQLSAMVFLATFIVYHTQLTTTMSVVSLWGRAVALTSVALLDDILDHILSIVPLATSVAVCEIGRRVISRVGINSYATILTLSILSVISINSVGIFLIGSNIGRKTMVYFKLDEPAIHIAEWAKRNTSRESVFLIPIHNAGGWSRFRHLSQRNVFVTLKDGTAWSYAPWFADEWLRRIKALGLYESLGLDEKSFKIGDWLGVYTQDAKYYIDAYDKVDEKKVEALRRLYKIDYWITRATVKTRYPKVYEHSGWQVLRVNDSM